MSSPQHFSVWSNFIYFIAGIYALVIAIRKYRVSGRGNGTAVLFGIYGILILLTGLFSIIYHTHTPSWTGERKQSKLFDQWLAIDQGFALTILLYSILLFGYIIWFHKIRLQSILHNSNLYLTILFLILSIIFFALASESNRKAIDCRIDGCFQRNLDAYDIFHSNWHIFTSVALIFWINLLACF